MRSKNGLKKKRPKSTSGPAPDARRGTRSPNRFAVVAAIRWMRRQLIQDPNKGPNELMNALVENPEVRDYLVKKIIEMGLEKKLEAI